MFLTAVVFWQVALAVHIAAVVIGFGVSFAYPVIGAAGGRLDPRAMPWFHRVQGLVGRRIISPGLTVVVVSGLYLASKLHQWHAFYVQWGLGAALVLGAIGGMFFAPSERKLAELAEKDVTAAGDGGVTWSPEYLALAKRVSIVGAASGLLVLTTLYLMAVQAGS